MKKQFETLGVMIDMSRNAVMSIDGMKRFFPLLKSMGYNCVMLYTEDTYEIEEEPYFGYMRGRYTKSEMQEIDSYAESLGIEIIPCIQTLAHLNGTIRWEQIPVDYDDIMLVDDDRTYELIERMFAPFQNALNQDVFTWVWMKRLCLVGESISINSDTSLRILL